MLAKGAEAFGFRGAVWTNPRVSKLIQRELGVRYHPARVSRILKELGWTPQKPLVQAK
jgi:transposase